ncbi:hypothetical protein OG840_14890 [Streptomyces sp. NBC_01764]|nr:hypothetical protein [Streptomyces sp. NBC_01764]MCX4403089.1 hypothetical protein [Streptomyces sp. NBC_01764]
MRAPALSAARATGVGTPRRSCSQPRAAPAVGAAQGGPSAQPGEEEQARQGEENEQELHCLDLEVESHQTGGELGDGKLHVGEDEGERHAVSDEEAGEHGLASGEDRTNGVYSPDEDAEGDERLSWMPLRSSFATVAQSTMAGAVLSVAAVAAVGPR